MKKVDTDILEAQVRDLYKLQKQLKQIKEDEMTLRKAVARKLTDVDLIAGKTEEVIGGYIVKVATTEGLEIEDKDALVDLVLEGNLTKEEQAALKLKPDITIARARKLDPDSVIWQYMYVKLSPTPTVTIEPLAGED